MKALIFLTIAILAISVIYVWVSYGEIQLKPFKISVKYPEIGIGWIFAMIAIAFITIGYERKGRVEVLEEMTDHVKILKEVSEKIITDAETLQEITRGEISKIDEELQKWKTQNP